MGARSCGPPCAGEDCDLPGGAEPGGVCCGGALRPAACGLAPCQVECAVRRLLLERRGEDAAWPERAAQQVYVEASALPHGPPAARTRCADVVWGRDWGEASWRPEAGGILLLQAQSQGGAANVRALGRRGGSSAALDAPAELTTMAERGVRGETLHAVSGLAPEDGVEGSALAVVSGEVVPPGPRADGTPCVDGLAFRMPGFGSSDSGRSSCFSQSVGFAEAAMAVARRAEHLHDGVDEDPDDDIERASDPMCEAEIILATEEELPCDPSWEPTSRRVGGS
ncbi:unnamed protein product [Prorocentrum cordatum]|uniref:Uncharacterized protein n=1 Tax=Prorocentrum cordatum TaxID=2364126 RepID=A0ABN9VI35_9DINO|nr:unnamed protein product [Polarella glacialis]